MKNQRGRWLFRLGLPLSPIYAALMRKRAAWYRSGVMESTALEVPVISIGNLTMGGTGKTPMVMYAARTLKDAGYNPAIVSRGYGGRARQEVNLVSDGEKILLDAAAAGDEPRLMAESLPGIPVVTGVRRPAVAEFAVSELGADSIIMDDGFQHLALQRDLDLVLFKAPGFLGSGRVFPGGELREPVSALARADAFVLTGAGKSNQQETEDFKEFLAGNFPGKPVFKVIYRLKELVDRDGGVHETSGIGERIFGFCGLAEPGGFLQTISESGINPYGFSVFPDHHPYTAGDLEMVADEAERFSCDALLTTEKDMVKLRDIPSRLPLYAFRTEVEIKGDLDKLLLDTVASKKARVKR